MPHGSRRGRYGLQHGTRMKTIGLIGGMSWESTVSYYRLINEGVKHALGGLHSARLMLYSVDFHDIEGLQRSADWDAACLLYTSPSPRD